MDGTSGGESEMEDEEVYFSYMTSDYSEETEEREGAADGAKDSEGEVEQEEDGKLTDVM